MQNKVQVLGNGHIELDGAFACDLDVVNAARVSYNVRHEEMDDDDPGLIRFLMKHKHGTPFEANLFKFRVKAPIFVFREWHRHRIGISINEVSGRYVELPEEFYVPAVENVRVQVGRPGHYTYEQAPGDVAAWLRWNLLEQSEHAFAMYREAMANGVAKEQARMFLPVNTMSEMIWTCNARSLMAFLALRNHDRAQWEIREYAKAMEAIFAKFMPITAQAFIDNGRVAP